MGPRLGRARGAQAPRSRTGLARTADISNRTGALAFREVGAALGSRPTTRAAGPPNLAALGVGDPDVESDSRSRARSCVASRRRLRRRNNGSKRSIGEAETERSGPFPSGMGQARVWRSAQGRPSGMPEGKGFDNRRRRRPSRRTGAARAGCPKGHRGAEAPVGRGHPRAFAAGSLSRGARRGRQRRREQEDVRGPAILAGGPPKPVVCP